MLNRTNLFVFLFLLSANASFAQLTWSTTSRQTDRVSCIYFIDKNLGFFSTGSVPGGVGVLNALYRTTDGGTVWSYIPISGLGGYGIQDIHFDDLQNGYACGSGTFWRTTDAGLTWINAGGIGLSTPIATIKTKAGIFVTDFFEQLMFSNDNGASFILKPTNSIAESHLGIDFVDSVHGVVDANYRQISTAWHYTTDGGVTWKPNNVQMESWSIHGEKGTSRFYACPEGYSTGVPYNSQVLRSTDFGKSFQEVYRFAFKMTGHITSAGGILYTQTYSGAGSEAGVYRSTDQGVTWTWLGGPNGNGDTRFFVMPDCGGNIIYVAGDDGKIYKAVDNIGTGGESDLKELLCIAHFNTSAPISPGTKVTIPIGIQIGNEPDFIGAKPEEIEYVIEFSTFAIDTAKFNMASDVVPPIGWALKSAVMKGDSLKVVLLNVASDAMTNSQGFGFVVLTALNDSPKEYSGVILRSVSFTSTCSRIRIEPTIEQSTLTRIRISSSSVNITKQDNQLSLFPNPATKNLTLRSDLLSTGKSSITIFDVRGVAVLDMMLPPEASTVHQLSLEMLPKGSYTLRLSHPTHAPIVKAFIIE